MTRLSLSPDSEEWEQGRFRFHDAGSDSSDEDFISASFVECEYGESESDVAYEQLDLFPADSWGRTRFSLDPAVTPNSTEHRENHLDLLTPFSSVQGFVQSYPPLHSYVDPNTVSTATLIRYDDQVERKKHMRLQNERDADQNTQAFRAASLAHTVKTLGQPSLRHPNETPLAMPSEIEHDMQQKIAHEKSRMHRDHLKAAQDLKQLIRDTQKQARQILAHDRELEEAQHEAEAEHQRKQAERRRQLKARKDAESKATQEKEEEERIEETKINDARAAKAVVEAKKTEYLALAEKLVVKLQTLRQSLEPFETSTVLSKRRLNMKKVVRGKVNTLAENAEKIKSVAVEVEQAIAAARVEDEDLKRRMVAGNTQITDEMTRGKRYFMDLLASSVMVRVQAEGFNGLRGDGFPLANMLALISLGNKELAPILAAHIYTVCPTAIPKLPSPSSDASEEALMKSIGMVKDKNGEYETFSRFLLRTEGIISLVANIMASNPPHHRLMDGHKGAVDWLRRFIGHLPVTPHSPLPLLTAPVLDAFLTGAGHMLANKHPEEFNEQLAVIHNDILHRLDEGAIGQPSATRLKKTVKDGFDGFKNALPPKALKELYCGADGSDGNPNLLATMSLSSSNAFGSIATVGTNAALNNPFRVNGTSSNSATSFGPSSIGNNLGERASNPFVPSASNNAGHGASNPSGLSTSNYTGQGASNRFGYQSPVRAFGASSFKASPFGQRQSEGLGGESYRHNESNPNHSSTPFRAPRCGTCPLSGGGLGGPMSGSTPFGGSLTNPGANIASNPFGRPTGSGGAFGSGGIGQPEVGTLNKNSMGRFGITGNKSFNAGSGELGSSSAFGASASSRAFPLGSLPGEVFCSSSGSNAVGGGGFASFGNPPDNGFGAKHAFDSGEMSSQQQIPFNAGGMKNQPQKPFGSSSTDGSGGNLAESKGGGGKLPCKFFAQGHCRFGDICRFSHSADRRRGGGFEGGSDTVSRRFY